MILAKALKHGDKIGFFSPSSPATVFAPNRFKRAKSYLNNQGFKLEAGSLTEKSDYYRSGNIKERVKEINELIRNPEIRCIISTIGGSNSNALLPYIDYEALLQDPKIIIGYSDVTAILLGIFAKTNIVTFHGAALVASFGELPPLVDETYKSFNDLLCKESFPPFYYSMPKFWSDMKIEWENQFHPKKLKNNNWQFLGSGTISGRIIGGNLHTIAAIWGSPYMPEILYGDILLIEDSMKSIDMVERSLCHLKACGVFDKISAIILGKYELFDDKGTNRTPLDVLFEVLNKQKLPILYGFDSCHTHPILATPIGIEAEINFEKKSFCLKSPWIK
ncbi:S66 family peptidase [Candidatus Photodesmus blepharus]|uniref:S66 family peptidase n=1 Tax=Candidatus Photodesmus blepharonis TaxID=1179155 RepID=UPI0005566236|nr:S66 peptidase family protein [Candidatus Photodesmus blepharus]